MAVLNESGVKTLVDAMYKRAHAPMTIAYKNVDRTIGTDIRTQIIYHIKVCKIPKGVIDESNLSNYEFRFYRYVKSYHKRINEQDNANLTVDNIYQKNVWIRAIKKGINGEPEEIEAAWLRTDAYDSNISPEFNTQKSDSYFYIPWITYKKPRIGLATGFEYDFYLNYLRTNGSGSRIIKWGSQIIYCPDGVQTDHVHYVTAGIALFNKTTNKRITNIVPFKIGFRETSYSAGNSLIIPANNETIGQ